MKKPDENKMNDSALTINKIFEADKKRKKDN